ncbi:coiled-coil domain-containing protein 177 [Xenopus laevis]|uniref:Coiled-coil domain-containing protein 185 n=2 Tax=Xenopus laevis TaxID=8355 RepID=A0A974CVQ5_XENLA|nr:coiled-coil domain-containing protein 177 [Xenopus laevis]OCT79451.1 hypothetical protein XELAEV_18026261mg [Xenopus laevis]
MERGGRRSPNLHLNLYNFQEGQDSRYVLTSPRSLEACARLGIRPVDLLPRSLEEVAGQHSNAFQGQLNELWEEYEEERRRRLRLCKQLRAKIVQEEPRAGGPQAPSAGKGAKETENDGAQVKLRDYTAVPSSYKGDTDCTMMYSTQTNTRKAAALEKERNEPTAPFSSNRWAPKLSLVGPTPPRPSDLRRSLSLGDLTDPEIQVRQLARDVEREARVCVSQRDKKIAALMLVRHRDENLAQQRKLKAQKAWQDLLSEEQRLKEAVSKPDWINQQHGRICKRRSRSSNDDWRGDITTEYLKEKTADLNTGLNVGLERSTSNMDKIHIDELTHATNEEFNNTLFEERMSQAFKFRLMKELQNKKNLQVKNQYERLRHNRLKEKVDIQAKAEEEFMRMSIKQKELKSQELYGQLLVEKNKELKEKAAKEEEQMFMAKLRAEQQQKEQIKHKAMLAKLTDQKIQHAKDSLGRSIQIKAERTREVNTMKEKVHQLLKEKVDEEDKNYRKQMKYLIRKKDSKCHKLLKEKEATVEQGKKTAMASFQMRERIREQTRSRTFDQMVRQAEMNASLLRYPS